MAGIIRDDFGCRDVGEGLDGLESRLGSGGQHYGRPIVLGQLPQHIQNRVQKFRGQGLGLVQDDDAPGQAVQFAGGAGPVGEKAVEELHRGRYNHRGVPVLGGQPRPHLAACVFFILVHIGHGVVFQHHVRLRVRVLLQKFPVDLRRLLRDGHERSGRYYSPQSVRRGVAQRESQCDRVFPPPVGTVSRKTPGGLSAAARQASYTSDRTALTGPEALLTLSWWRVWNRSQSWAISGDGIA